MHMFFKVLGVVIAMVALYLIVDAYRMVHGPEGRTWQVFGLWLMNTYIMVYLWWKSRCGK